MCVCIYIYTKILKFLRLSKKCIHKENVQYFFKQFIMKFENNQT